MYLTAYGNFKESFDEYIDLYSVSDLKHILTDEKLYSIGFLKEQYSP